MGDYLGVLVDVETAAVADDGFVGVGFLLGRAPVEGTSVNSGRSLADNVALIDPSAL